MQLHYSRLSEKDRRQYAGLEAVKLGWGGISYISALLGIHKRTVREGIKELAAETSHFASELQTPIHKLSAADKESLLLSLLDIIRHLNQQGIITIQRMCFTCAHYKPSANGKNHFCNLLNQKLASADLRIDCPEHFAVAQ